MQTKPPIPGPSRSTTGLSIDFIDTNYFKVLKIQNQLINRINMKNNHVILLVILKLWELFKIIFLMVKESLGTLALKENYLVQRLLINA